MSPVHCCQRPRQQLRRRQPANLESVFEKCWKICQLHEKLSLFIKNLSKGKTFSQQTEIHPRYFVKYQHLASLTFESGGWRLHNWEEMLKHRKLMLEKKSQKKYNWLTSKKPLRSNAPRSCPSSSSQAKDVTLFRVKSSLFFLSKKSVFSLGQPKSVFMTLTYHTNWFPSKTESTPNAHVFRPDDSKLGMMEMIIMI